MQAYKVALAAERRQQRSGQLALPAPSPDSSSACACMCSIDTILGANLNCAYCWTDSVPQQAGLMRRPTACNVCSCRCGCSCCASSGASEQSSDGASDSASLCNVAADAAGAALVRAGADLLSPIEGAVLRLTDSMVTLDCADAVALFDKAEEITDGKVRRGWPGPLHARHFIASWWLV